jgi:hypothetical protein
MNNELLASIERGMLGWPGVWRKREEDGPGGVAVTGYMFGQKQIGHVHHGDDILADFSFPREVRDELIPSGRVIPHPAFPSSRTAASYWVRSAENVPGAVELFRMNYGRVKAAAGEAQNVDEERFGGKMENGTAKEIEREVAGWPGGTTGDTGRGGLQFSYGRVELGHLHGNSFADLPFTKKIRDELIAQGRASVHPPLPNSGWVRRRMGNRDDAEAVIELFRINYDRAKARAERRTEQPNWPKKMENLS